jgi:hypothetical protein
MYLSNVVFPEPRNPDNIVTGMGLYSSPGPVSFFSSTAPASVFVSPSVSVVVADAVFVAAAVKRFDPVPSSWMISAVGVAVVVVAFVMVVSCLFQKK